MNREASKTHIRVARSVGSSTGCVKQVEQVDSVW
jgi:hypothetical protein